MIYKPTGSKGQGFSGMCRGIATQVFSMPLPQKGGGEIISHISEQKKVK